LSEPSGQESHGKTGRQQWDRAEGLRLYLSGKTHAQIGEQFGITRESISRVAADENWRAKAAEIHTEALQQAETSLVEPRRKRLIGMDADVDELVLIARKRIAYLKAMPIKKVSFAELDRAMDYYEKAVSVSRGMLGMSKTEGIVTETDRVLIVQTQRLPATKAEYDAQ